MSESQSFSAAVGARLKQARQRSGRSLSGLAAEAGIGKGSLSEIEAGRRNPTLSTVYAVANSLGLPLSTLLPEHPGAELHSSGVTARLLHTSAQAERQTVEVFLLSLEPGERRVSSPHAPGTVEHLYMTEGAGVVGSVQEPVRISAGEAAAWSADVEHSYEAVGGPAAGVLTITTPAVGGGETVAPADVSPTR